MSGAAASEPPSERCVAEARGVLVTETDASLAPSVAVVPDVQLGSAINEALAAVAPVVTLPLSTDAILSAAAAAAAASRKRPRDDGGDGEGGAPPTTTALASFLQGLPRSVPPALKDALRLLGGIAHDHLGVPLPGFAGGDGGGDDDGTAAAAAASDAALGWSCGGGSSSSNKKGRWLAVAADPLAASLPVAAGGMAVPAATGAVLVFDVPAAALPPAAAAAAGAGTAGTGRTTRAAAAASTKTTTTPTITPAPPLTQPHVVLVHELQRRASCAAWRPGRPNHLAVGCAGGAALWSLSARPPAAAGLAAAEPPPPLALGPGAATAFCTFLRHRRRARVTSLAWSPDGRLLAGASASSAALAVWDASMGGGGSGGGGARLRAPLSPGLARLSWSPCGRYLFAAGTGGGRASGAGGLASALLAPPGRFHLWETGRWRSQAWDVPGGGRAVAACWAGGGASSSSSSSSSSGPVAPLLIAMSHSSSLVALHLVGGPGTLAEQLLPVALPGVSDVCRTGAGGGGGGKGRGSGGASPSSSLPASDAGCIADLAWDPSARRLAVALRMPHPAAGCVALYATRAAPVVSAQLVGFLRPFGAGGAEAGGQQGAAARAGEGLRLAFAPQPLLARGSDDDAHAPSAAGGEPAAVLSVRDLLPAGGEEGGEEEEGGGGGGGGGGGFRGGGGEVVANIALHF